jgi:hypothetical protein
VNPVPPPSHPAPPPVGPSTLVRPGHRAAVPHGPSPRPARGWAWAGVAAGLLGPVVLLGTAGIYSQAAWNAADSAVMAASVADHTAVIWAHQGLAVLITGLLVVFGLGLRRHLAAGEPPHGLVPDVAATGVLLTAGSVFLGAGLDTELWWAVQAGAAADPDTVGSMVNWYGTASWLWGGLGLSAAAVAFGGLAHRSSGRLIGWVSAALAVVLAATQATPVQYIAVLPGALWLVVVGVAGVRRGTPQGPPADRAH